MADLFDSTNYPTTEPEILVIGDRWLWKRTDIGSDYAPSSYALSYNARLLGTGSTTFSITASESGTDYIVEVAALQLLPERLAYMLGTCISLEVRTPSA